MTKPSFQLAIIKLSDCDNVNKLVWTKISKPIYKNNPFKNQLTMTDGKEERNIYSTNYKSTRNPNCFMSVRYDKVELLPVFANNVPTIAWPHNYAKNGAIIQGNPAYNHLENVDLI